MSVLAADMSDSTIVWSKTYEGIETTYREPRRFRMVHDVTAALLQPFGVITIHEEVKRASNDDMNDSYRCVLDSHEYLRSFDLKRHAAIRACLEHATAQSPGWVSPFVQLARIYLREHEFGFSGRVDGHAALERAYETASRAIRVKPTSASAQMILQDVLLARGDLDGARIAGETALRYNPYDRAVIFGHASLLLLLGQSEEGLVMMNQVSAETPIKSTRYHFMMALTAYLKGDLLTADAETSQITNPNYPPGLMFRAMMDGKMGNRQAARRAVAALDAAYPTWRANLRDNIGRFVPVPAMAERIAADFVATTSELTQ